MKYEDLDPGYYKATGCRDDEDPFYFLVDDHPTCGINIWGFSIYRRSPGYRTYGIRLSEWLSRQDVDKLSIEVDRDRTKER